MEFTKLSVQEVEGLRKQAAALADELAQARTELTRKDAQIAQLEGQTVKQASAPAFEDDRVQEVAGLLVTTGLVKEASAEQVAENIRRKPGTILDLLETFITSDREDEGSLTTLKTANTHGKEDINSLWRKAVS